MTPARRFKRLLVRTMDGLVDGVAAALPRRLCALLGLAVPAFALPPGGTGVTVGTEAGPVRLVLDPQDVLAVDVPLPKGGLMAGMVDARGFVEMQAHRFMPMRPDLLAWDVVILENADGKKGDGVARVHMVRRSVLSAAQATAARMGLQVRGVTAAVAVGPPPEFLRFDRARVRRRAVAVAVAACLFWLALPIPLVIAIRVLDRQTATVEATLAAVAKDARGVQDMRDRIAFLAPDAAATAVLLAQPGRGQVLDELAYTLPDTVWVRDLVVRPGGIEVQGRAADLADVLARMRAASPFTDAHFVEPAQVAPAPTPPGIMPKDFTLAFSLVGGGD
ncbi:MAG: PilN domain-containing protein [Azospirillaceae bacterium]|nr:PilN domain-containing protein [Azospirillaceae bacterium]